jgi:hypothetical protein
MRRLVIAPLVVGVAACGGGDTSPKPQPAPERAPAVLRTSCSDSWWPNARTFADRRWREHSVAAGPVTFLNANRLADIRIAGRGSVKIRTLVRPRTPVTIAIGRTARRTAGFVPLTSGGAAGFEAARPLLRLEGCDGVPRSEQAVPGLADVGFPISVAATSQSCVPLEVTPDGGPTSRVVVSLGAGDC